MVAIFQVNMLLPFKTHPTILLFLITSIRSFHGPIFQKAHNPLCVVCHDPDVPSRPDDVNQEGREVPADLHRVDFFHWIVVNIPAAVQEIAAGAHSNGVTPRGKPANLAGEWKQGLNDYTGWFAGDEQMGGEYYGYDGPCPPWNDARMHHYIFTVYALATPVLAVDGPLDGRSVLAALDRAPVLGRASLIGRYTLNPRVA